ncbi:MAG: hypothetical protein RR482_00895 [Clostridia bacterium]
MHVCRKSAVYNGKRYLPGDALPDGTVLTHRVNTLLRMGMIDRVEASAANHAVADPPAQSTSQAHTPATKPKSKGGRSK